MFTLIFTSASMVPILAANTTVPFRGEVRTHQISLDLNCWDDSNTHLKDPFCALINTHCPSAPEVSHGSHGENYSTSIGSRVIYKCADGYTLIGSATITCEITDLTLQWSTPPVCKKGNSFNTGIRQLFVDSVALLFLVLLLLTFDF